MKSTFLKSNFLPKPVQKSSIRHAGRALDAVRVSGRLRCTNIGQRDSTIGGVSIIIPVGIAIICCGRFRVVGAMVEIQGERLAIIGTGYPRDWRMNAKLGRNHRNGLARGDRSQ